MTVETPEVIRRFAKYVFLDVVQFSTRSNEAQSDIVNQLNSIVRESLDYHQVPGNAYILIPTGDGICIALINSELPYDIHMQIALRILTTLDVYNAAITDSVRQFQIRIGINQHPDIIVTDINDRKNIAGAGINNASRIMGKADGNQILVSRAVFDDLQPSEKYKDSFQPYTATAKHNLLLQLYQFIGKGHSGLNTDVPSAWKKHLTLVVAYYFAHAIQNREFLIKNQSDEKTVIAIVLLWLFAVDSCGERGSTEANPHVPLKHRDILDRALHLRTSFTQQFAHYMRTYRPVAGALIPLVQFIMEILEPYQSYFEIGKFPPNLIFVNEAGAGKLKAEWPNIWMEFNFAQ